MCEVLIRAKTNGFTGSDWQRGDIVAVQNDGHVWGRFETKASWIASGGTAETWPGDFYLLKIPGRSVADFETLYRNPWLDETGAVLLARSLWHFRVDDLSKARLNSLNDAGEATADRQTDKDTFSSIFRNKASQELGAV